MKLSELILKRETVTDTDTAPPLATATDIKQEERRERVLAILEDNPDKQRAYVTDDESDSNNVILTIAIRGVASFEMLIPKNKYDPFVLMDLIARSKVQ